MQKRGAEGDENAGQRRPENGGGGGKEIPFIRIVEKHNVSCGIPRISENREKSIDGIHKICYSNCRLTRYEWHILCVITIETDRRENAGERSQP